ncbi:PLDc N-terminal domain-containing protein [Salinimicrobium flavum]|uniref:PLDc N-terminal domain-containing protein n=1 Tax=Salinimicrobium flavum TaxID=1737065 RepID=A0ABW5IWS9_9FLAO
MIGHFIRYRIPLIILFFLFQFLWLSGNNSLLHLESLKIPGWISLLFLSSFWIIVLTDMIRTEIYNKTFWLFSMLIFPWLAPAIYLFLRKKLKHLQTSFFRKR